MTIQELMNKRAQVWDAAKKLLDEKTDKNGLMSAEDAQAYDRMEKEIEDLGRQIERQQRAKQTEDMLKKPMGKEIKNEIGGGEMRKAGKLGTDEYRNAFWDGYMRNSVQTYEIRNALQVGVDTEGGYLAPEEFERTLIEALTEANVFRALAHVITTSNDRKIPVVTSRGEAQWIEEGAEYPESDNAFGQLYLQAHKLATRIKISEELMRDSAFNMAAYIAKEFARRIGEAEEAAYIGGDGVGKPTGVLKSAETGVTAASANAITGDEIIDLYYSLRAPYRKKAVFLTHDSVIKNLRKLKDGNDQYIWQPALTAGAPDTLLGKAVHTSQFMPEVATGKTPMLFGDLSYYWIGDRAGYTFKRLNELYADMGQIGFIASKRTDGKLLLPEAVKTIKMA